MTEIEKKVLGGLLGVHAGDSLGATHEFRSWDEIVAGHPAGWRLRDIIGGGAFGWAPGAATDDTDLTVAVLDAYLADGGFRLEQAAANMLTWMQGGPRDIGNATRAGLQKFAASSDPRCAGAGPGAAGNGSLMRCLPTALARSDAAVRMRESAEISAVTHDDPSAVWACIAYNEIAAALLAGNSVADAARAGRDAALGADDEVGSVVAQAIDKGQDLRIAALAAKGGNPYGRSGYVLSSFSLAVAAMFDERGLEDVLIDVVHLGGDTDTNGAIAGGLLGVRDGADAIPARWVEQLQYRDAMRTAAPQIVARRDVPA